MSLSLSWTQEQCVEWLLDNDLAVFIEHFFEMQMNGETMMELTKEYLLGFGFIESEIDGFLSKRNSLIQGTPTPSQNDEPKIDYGSVEYGNSVLEDINTKRINEYEEFHKKLDVLVYDDKKEIENMRKYCQTLSDHCEKYVLALDSILAVSLREQRRDSVKEIQKILEHIDEVMNLLNEISRY